MSTLASEFYKAAKLRLQPGTDSDLSSWDQNSPYQTYEPINSLPSSCNHQTVISITVYMHIHNNSYHISDLLLFIIHDILLIKTVILIADIIHLLTKKPARNWLPFPYKNNLQYTLLPDLLCSPQLLTLF
jgi:hypothetical protein